MKTSFRVFIIVLLVAVVAILSVIIYRAYRYLETPQAKAYSAIPHTATLLIKSITTQYLLDFHNQQKAFFPVLLSELSTSQIDVLLKEISSKEKLAANSSFFLSMHEMDGEEKLFFAIETSKEHNPKLDDFFKALQKQYGKESFDYKDKTINRLHIRSNSIYANFQHGLLLLSFDENLMRMAINQSNEDAYFQDIIERFPNQRNANAKMLLYVQHNYFNPYLKNKIRKAGGDEAVADLLSPCRLSVFDVDVKKGDVVFSGYTSIEKSSQQYVLLNHSDNTIDFEKILPEDANRIFPLTAHEAKDFRKITPIVQVSEDFFSLMYPKQIIFFESKTDTALHHYLIIKSENSSEAAFHLLNSLESSFANGNYLLDTFYVGTSMSGHIRLSNFVLTKLGIGSQFPMLNYYTIIDDYIIFADNKDGILHYLTQMRENKTVKKSSSYKDIQSYFSDRANLFYYYKFPENNTSENPYLKQYAKNMDRVRVQLYAQSDSTLISNVILRTK